MTGSSGTAAGAPLRSIRIIGTGLIGTSIGLAASAAGLRVTLDDQDGQRRARAAGLGAGVPASDRDQERADLVVVAVPPSGVAQVSVEAIRLGLARTVTHVASVQAQPLVEMERAGVSLARFVGSHPIAGRELSGPDAASGDLFRDRAWVVCPGRTTAEDAVADVEALAVICRGRPVRMAADAHDRLLARLSHAPQLVSSALAAAVADLADDDVALAGSGLRDTTRLAGSDPELWAEIVGANPAAVAAALRDVAGPLLSLAAALETAGPDAAGAVRHLLERGREGRAKLPGKHGRRQIAWSTVSVVVPDRPGALAELLAAVAGCRVNLEDLRVEHAPGQPEGAAELAVAPDAQERLAAALRADGWSVTLGADASR